MKLQDSGERREFESGAVRDISQGKGRCDLLPLDVLAMYFADDEGPNKVFMGLHNYVYSGSINYVLDALRAFGNKHYPDSFTMFIEVAKHYEDGAEKYSERNWEMGIPGHCYVDSGSRHYMKFLRGDTDEPHDRAFVWNMLCLVRTHTNIFDYIDLPFNQKGAQKIIDNILKMKVGEKKNED